MKRIQKFGGCNYSENARKIVLNELDSCNMMSEINLKGNDGKINITDMEISKFIVGTWFVY